MKARILNIDDSHMEFNYDFVTKIITKLKLEDNLEVRKDIKSILIEAKEIILEKQKSKDEGFFKWGQNSSLHPSQEQIDAMKTIEGLANRQNRYSKSGGLPSSTPPDPNNPKKNK